MSDSSKPAAARKRVGGVIKPHEPKWHQRIAAWIIYVGLRSVAATIRFRWHDGSNDFLAKHAAPAIYCAWHNRLGLCLHSYYAYVPSRTKTRGIAAMCSASKDGALLAAILECFKVQPVRGSSSRRGPQALLELISWAKQGYDLAITPDVPRGPCYIVQEGVISLAQVTGWPIMPFSYDLKWKIRLKSWDRFQVPMPFTRCEMKIGQPLIVPPEAGDAEREAARAELERRLRALTDV